MSNANMLETNANKVLESSAIIAPVANSDVDTKQPGTNDLNDAGTGGKPEGRTASTGILRTTSSSSTTSGKTHRRTDVLYCLTTSEEDGKGQKHYYKDQPWKGVDNGLPGTEADEEADAVMIYTVAATVQEKTKKKGNSAMTWRDEPVDFQFKRDAHLLQAHKPKITFWSKRLIRTMEQLMSYYPSRFGSYNVYTSILDNIFIEVLYFFPEMKRYLKTYQDTIAGDLDKLARLSVGSCGDEAYSELIEPWLDFGVLDLNEPCDEATAYDVAVLLRTLASMYRVKVAPTMSSLLLDTEPRIAYDRLWLLLRPGTYVYVQGSSFADSIIKRTGRDEDKVVDDPFPEDNERTAWVVSSWKYKNGITGQYLWEYEQPVDHIFLELWSVDFDGKVFQRVARPAILFRFDGYRAVRGLEILPAQLYDRLDHGVLRRQLERRGRKYLKIFHEPTAHREYHHALSGYHGQIIVDPLAFYQYSREDHRGYYHPRSRQRFFPIVDGDGGKKFQSILDFLPSTSGSFERINEVYVLLPRSTQGLGLKTKRWMTFEIDHISDKIFDYPDNQLDNELVLVSEEDKAALRTVLPKSEQVVGIAKDFIADKGEGKIFLLYGPPGTGKTLTVECVANDTRRPLISLTIADIGDDWTAEAKLRKWFAVASKWDAILLIDEADLFLEQRRDGDAARNGLATIFLRSMEYYTGVLFLTTNRPGHIDDSFISRITCPIAYRTLSVETKARITYKFVRKFEESSTIEVQKSAVNYLVENCQDFNGRQIRNILQNAVAAAEVQQRFERREASSKGKGKEDVDLIIVKRHHVKGAVERQHEFRTYLEGIKGGRDEPARAKSRQDYLSAS
ncbi:hypothetical protein F5Y18DRAFT_405809 [Xylariaceae sp. FL1019]|nr:hypothetical protein F5Y18DRAFT_405809 [Xylariaceae sp. FL1019]